jgi:hypothetical protein
VLEPGEMSRASVFTCEVSISQCSLWNQLLTVNRNGTVWLFLRADGCLLKSGQMLMVRLVCAIAVHGHHIQNDAVVGHAVDGSH